MKLEESFYLRPDVVKIARHPMRPYASDYISRVFTEFEELHGDRHFGEARVPN